jgi:hypothetical protein
VASASRPSLVYSKRDGNMMLAISRVPFQMQASHMQLSEYVFLFFFHVDSQLIRRRLMTKLTDGESTDK